jgi:hypothetical protein
MVVVRAIAKSAQPAAENARKWLIKSLASLGSRGRKGNTLEKKKPPLREVARAAALSFGVGLLD